MINDKERGFRDAFIETVDFELTVPSVLRSRGERFNELRIWHT